jgi:hypothetical protein
VKTALTPPWQQADVPGWSWTEFTVGSATVRRPVEDVVDVLAEVLITGMKS